MLFVLEHSVSFSFFIFSTIFSIFSIVWLVLYDSSKEIGHSFNICENILVALIL